MLITFLRIEKDDLTEEEYMDLWNLSNCKADEPCWSFLVRVDLLEGWLKDIETDKENGHEYPASRVAILRLVERAYREDVRAIFVVNDSYYSASGYDDDTALSIEDSGCEADQKYAAGWNS
jgi:hypothetical protein